MSPMSASPGLIWCDVSYSWEMATMMRETRHVNIWYLSHLSSRDVFAFLACIQHRSNSAGLRPSKYFPRFAMTKSSQKAMDNLPPEILLQIIEQCTISSIVNLLAVNKAKFALVSNYQMQIAVAVLERPDSVASYQTCFAHIENPSGKCLALLRELRSRRTRKACLRMLVMMEG